MPVMIRPNKGALSKGKKIAYNILGTPPNMDNKSYESSKENKRLSYEETRRVRGAI